MTNLEWALVTFAMMGITLVLFAWVAIRMWLERDEDEDEDHGC